MDFNVQRINQEQTHNADGYQEQHNFSEQDQHGLYKAIFNRRDVRGQFLPKAIPKQILSRILYAAHHAPSVGFMQPWDFIIIQSPEVKNKIHQDFTLAHQEAQAMFDNDKQSKYKNLKLEGIIESPINVCITCDRERTGKTVIGRTHMKEMDLYSSVCAVQNFWLAARTEGVGVGWVSILHHDALRKTLSLPDNIVPIAYLCLGYVSHFKEKPELETANWLPRRPIDELVSFDAWGKSASNSDEKSLIAQLQSDEKFPHSFTDKK
ncbi:5,6-dimethylbenzimidazole synthase [Cognaticolwellia mytili]|uniref:5,6-dimethylbenzimidazole synthase n=1 Tax=Cognaticolwellia mytili TaxID=1888913 RepID=UPI000A16FE51|nr:5,6-dimethylbenzimidazole synthase [Cognaticolwellia mytili]